MQNMVMPPVYSVKWLLPQPGFLSEGIQIHVYQVAEPFSLFLWADPSLYSTQDCQWCHKYLSTIRGNGWGRIHSKFLMKVSRAHQHHTRKLLQRQCTTYFIHICSQQTE